MKKLIQCSLFFLLLVHCSPPAKSCAGMMQTSCTCGGYEQGLRCNALGVAEICTCTGALISSDAQAVALDAQAVAPDSRTDSIEWPQCGDGVCHSTEDCSVCPVDCGECSCRSCVSNADCSEGEACSQRTCDGLKSCYPKQFANLCNKISGVWCPKVWDYYYCRTQSDCGPLAKCAYINNGLYPHCVRSCTTDQECNVDGVTNSAGFAAVCVSGNCFLTCQVPMTACPFDMTCNRTVVGTFWARCG